MDFLCGWTLQEMVWPSSTLTHRTMYDWIAKHDQLAAQQWQPRDACRTLLWISNCSIPAMMMSVQ